MNLPLIMISARKEQAGLKSMEDCFLLLRFLFDISHSELIIVPYLISSVLQDFKGIVKVVCLGQDVIRVIG